MARISIIGGDGRRSGIPTLIQLLCEVFADDHHLSVASDINRGGFDFLSSKGIEHTEISGLGSSLNPGKILTAFIRLRRSLIAQAPDVIWVQSSVSVLLARLVLLELRWFRRRQTALIVGYQGVPFGKGRNPTIAVPLRVLEYLLLALAPRHVLLFTSQTDLGLIPRLLHRRHSVRIALNCSLLEVDAELAESTAELERRERRIVMTTRVSYQKNLFAAADIFALLPEEYVLHLLGSFTDGEAFKQEFLDRLPENKRDAVVFMGQQNDVTPYLLDSDVYLMTSRYEGLPFGAIEAFQCGLPIVLTDVGGTAEIAAVHPLFVEIDVSTQKSIAEAALGLDCLVARYREDPPNWRRDVHAAWEKQFSLRVWTESVKACLQDALSGAVR